MSDKKEPKAIHDEESAFEMIELAIDDMNVLTKAFNLISQVCEEEKKSLNSEYEVEEPPRGIPENLLN